MTVSDEIKQRRIALAELTDAGREAMERIKRNGWELTQLKPELGALLRQVERWQAIVTRGALSIRLSGSNASHVLEQLAVWTEPDPTEVADAAQPEAS
jgi:hypothetical protein